MYSSSQKTSTELMLAVPIARRQALADQLREMINRGPKGTTGDGIPVEITKEFQDKYDLNPFARVVFEKDERVIYAGPKKFADSFREFESNLGSQAVDYVERLKENKAVDPYRYFSSAPRERTTEKSRVYRALVDYEKALAKHFGNRLVLVNPSTATLFNMSRMVFEYVLRVQDDNIGDHIRSEADSVGGYREVFGTEPEKIYYYGSNGMKFFSDKQGFALVPNPYSTYFLGDSDFITTCTDVGIEMSYSRNGKVRDVLLSKYPLHVRYSPEELDHFSGKNEAAFFLESYYPLLPVMTSVKYKPIGSRFYLPLTDEDELSFMCERRDYRKGSVINIRGQIVDVPGPGTWMGRLRERETLAFSEGIKSIDYAKNGSYYVCMNSLKIEREMLVTDVGMNYSLISPSTVDVHVYVDVLPEGEKVISTQKGWVWHLGWDKGVVCPLLPGGSAQPILWSAIDDGSGGESFYLTKETSIFTYAWFFFSDEDFSSYQYELACQISNIHINPMSNYMCKELKTDVELKEWCLSDPNVMLTMKLIQENFPNHSKTFIRTVLNNEDWMVPDTDDGIIIRRDPMLVGQPIVEQIVGELRYYRTVIVKSNGPLISRTVRGLSLMGYRVGPYIKGTPQSRFGYTTVITQAVSRHDGVRFLVYDRLSDEEANAFAVVDNG